MNSNVLDVVIGLVFIYLIYSLFATVIQELYSTTMGLRARMLKLGISRMLNDDLNGGNKSRYFFESARRTLLTRTKNFKGTLAERFYDQPSIKYLGDQSWHSKPAYISAQNFSKTLIDLLKGEDFKPGDNTALKINENLFAIEPKLQELKNIPDTREHLQSLMADANGDIEKFRNLLEKWFEDTMERVSGWYKRKVQSVLLVIGFLIAAIFNVDTIAIVHKLSTDEAARAEMVKLATSNYKEFAYDTNAIKSLDSTLIANLKASMSQTNNVLSGDFKHGTKDSIMNSSIKIKRTGQDKEGLVIYEVKLDSTRYYKALKQSNIRPYTLTSFLGWIITALAISLGAPFWYDLLSKLVKVRGAGATPETVTQSGSGSKKGDKSITAAG